MRIFVTPDGAVFSGSTSEEIVTAMRDRGFYPVASPSLKTYMFDVIERLAFYFNEEIDCSLKEDGCDAFIETLVEKNYFRELTGNVIQLNSAQFNA